MNIIYIYTHILFYISICFILIIGRFDTGRYIYIYANMITTATIKQMLCLAPINRTSIKKYLYIHGLPRTSPQLPLQSDLLLPIPQPCSNQSQIPELSHFFVIGLLASLSCKDCNQLLGFCNWLTCYKWIFTYDSLELYIHIIYIYIHLKQFI